MFLLLSQLLFVVLMQNEHQALVYSLHTFTSYISPWMVNEHLALKAALTKCYDLEKIEYDNGNNNDLGSTFQRTEEQAEGEFEHTNDAFNLINTFLNVIALFLIRCLYERHFCCYYSRIRIATFCV